MKKIKKDKNLRPILPIIKRSRGNIPLKKGFETKLVKYSDIVLEPGCYYFIDDILERSSNSVRTIVHGKYVSMSPYEWIDRFDDSTRNNIEYTFSDIQYIVKPQFRNNDPVGNTFSDEGNIFIKDILAPCESDILNKKQNINELEETLDEMKYQPVEKRESNITFIGEAYREKKESWEKKHPPTSYSKSLTSKSRSKSRSNSRSNSRSKSASKKGGKNKTQKQRKTKK
jgi:hypothetical protein